MFKNISYLELWWLLSSEERNHLCNYSRGYYEEQVCEITLYFKLRPVVKGEMPLKVFLI